MIRLVMERADLTIWPVLSFMIFLASCSLMLAWMFRPGSGAFYARLSRAALNNKDDVGTGRS